MKLTVLGCSGSVPGPDSPASGYLVEADGYRLLLDLGHGAFGALQQYCTPADVDAIVISHLHADHCIDLTAYVVALRYGGDGYRLRGPERRIPLVGVPGTRDRLEAAYDPLARKLGLHELFSFATPADAELGPFTMSYAPMNHPTPTNGVKIAWQDRSLVYSADTGECPELVKLATGADVLLCEASVSRDEVQVPDLHLSGAQAGEHADRAGVDRLIITHVPPWNSRQDAADDAAEAFDGPVEIAHPRAEFWI
ncbi:MAG TPA: MBL fold metallo-hydrolase [Jatrophihabitans sp.]|jgi:ribonuclease BN (tRNA processing enzyme)|uniref:MBL fold metallo-hydrolase n=1 Tax=Jatrophihabitans sp. TaxID=1932789 RepID=UPI002E07E7FD|nr:MBL fold metallo-hydrolase [Jatrophihabitans sp.]